MEPYYEHDGIIIYNCDCREVLASLAADIVVTDPPYGETSLEWDRWQAGWVELLQPASMWCCGSLRMFLEHVDEFSGWKMSQDVIWKKHNGSNFHSESLAVTPLGMSCCGIPRTQEQRLAPEHPLEFLCGTFVCVRRWSI